MTRRDPDELRPGERRVPRLGVAIAVGLAIAVLMRRPLIGLAVGLCLAVAWGHLGGRRPGPPPDDTGPRDG